MARKRILIVGSGAREHALGSRLFGETLFFAPGNGGTASIGENLDVHANDIEALVGAAKSLAIDLVVVGPELPLTLGLVDALEASGIRAFGPHRKGAELEGSKAFMKRFAERHGIPTAPFRVFEDFEQASAYVRSAGRPMVVKADGLCAGKGVVVPSSVEETQAALHAMLVERKFGDAGARVVVEELLAGEEASFHCVVDGEAYLPLPSAKDHKRVFDGDRGPNTGGMGCVSPAPSVTPEVERQVLARIIEPTLVGFARDGIRFRGTLFAGLMVRDGEPSLLEYNVRFGDPETSTLVQMVEGDLLSLFFDPACALREKAIRVRRDQFSVSVVLAADGYPEAPKLGDPIAGLDVVNGSVSVYHAGTARNAGSPPSLVTSGGRVLVVNGTHASLDEARRVAYAAADRIEYRGKHFRRDIGQ